jgi:UTP--glucose-1-phosphate uridylyltransferase
MPLSRTFRALALPAALAFSSFTLVSASEADHAWEYEAVFDIQEASETYSLNMANAADETMKFCFAATDDTSAHGVQEMEGSCHADEESPTVITANAPATSIVSGVTYQVAMSQESWLSVFNIAFPEDGAYAFFAEHMPSEFHFEGGTEMALLKDGESHDVEPDWASDATDATRTTPWGNTMLGCLAVWVVTLCGLVLIVNSNVWEAVKPFALMFASGTLLSTAFALVLYESTHLIPIGDDEGLAAGRWTAMIMCGFITSPVIAVVIKNFMPSMGDEDNEAFPEPAKGGAEKTKALDACERAIDNCCDPDGVAARDSQDCERAIDNCCDPDGVAARDSQDCEKSITNASVRARFIMSMIAGDFFHNFTDGIFIGAAFQCNTSLAWKIVAVTVAHEVPQELGDFAVLTSSLGFSVPIALVYNVISGSSVMLGGITVMAAQVSNLDTGMLLAYGAGNYIYCATVHMFSQGSKNILHDVKRLLAFAVGAIAIGLILLDHEHCDASDAGGDAHAHHDHK